MRRHSGTRTVAIARELSICDAIALNKYFSVNIRRSVWSVLIALQLNSSAITAAIEWAIFFADKMYFFLSKRLSNNRWVNSFRFAFGFGLQIHSNQFGWRSSCMHFSKFVTKILKWEKRQRRTKMHLCETRCIADSFFIPLNIIYALVRLHNEIVECVASDAKEEERQCVCVCEREKGMERQKRPKILSCCKNAHTSNKIVRGSSAQNRACKHSNSSSRIATNTNIHGAARSV